MSTTNRRPGVEYVLGFLIGLGCGVGIGLLTAPQPGRESQAWLRARADAARRRAATFIRQNDAMGVMRRRGVRGLLQLLQQPATDKVPPPPAS